MFAFRTESGRFRIVFGKPAWGKSCKNGQGPNLPQIGGRRPVLGFCQTMPCLTPRSTRGAVGTLSAVFHKYGNERQAL